MAFPNGRPIQHAPKHAVVGHSQDPVLVPTQAQPMGAKIATDSEQLMRLGIATPMLVQVIQTYVNLVR